MGVLKNKKTVFSVITLILFLVCVCGNFFTVDSYAVRPYFTRSQSISAQLFSGDVLEQEFTLAEGDQGVQLALGTYLTVLEKGTIQAELFDKQGKKLAETSVDLTGMTDNKFANCYFGNLDESLYGQKLKVRFTFLDIDDQLIAVFDSNTDSDKYVYSVNGEERETNLSINGIKATTYVEYRDLRLFYVFGIGVLFAYLAIYKRDDFRLRDRIKQTKAFVMRNKKDIFVTVGLVIVSALVAVGYAWVKEGPDPNPYRTYSKVVVVLIIALVAYFRKYLLEYAHIFFFVICVLVGSVYITSVPAIGIGWDEQQHYVSTAYMSWGATNRISESDYLLYSKYAEGKYEDVFAEDDRAAWVEEINAVDAQGAMHEFYQSTSFGSVAYVIPSIMLYATRSIGMDFVARFTLGRYLNLVLYALIMAMAMKALKGRGRILVATIGLIPTNLLLACSYSYDWWVNALIILGYSMFIGELQEHGRISLKKQKQCVWIMVLAMLPKAVYFPLLLPFMFLKKDSYEDVKKSRWMVILGMVALLVSFMLPFVVNIGAGAVAGGGDGRGGNDVNAIGQITYILENPQRYYYTLRDFLRKYLNPDQSMKYLTEMAAYPRGEYHSICLILLAVATLFDNTKYTVFKIKERVATAASYVSVIGTIMIVATSFYVIYTPVADPWIDGCQLRYLLPVLFTFLFVAGENALDIPEDMKKKVYVWCLFGMSAVALRTFLYSFIF